MNLNDIIALDNTDSEGPIDDILVAAMASLGFTQISYRISRVLYVYLAIITGIRADGSTMEWKGAGATVQMAETNAVDELAKWIMQQQVGATATP